MNTKHMTCGMLEEFLSGGLSEPERTLFMAHLEQCDACMDQIKVSEKIRAAFHQFSAAGLPDYADLRIRGVLRRELSAPHTAKDIMDLEEAAVWLGVSSRELAEWLDEIPAFEIGGRIRFNRKRLEEWMIRKEQDQSRLCRFPHDQVDSNLLSFPGGTHDEQNIETENSRFV